MRERFLIAFIFFFLCLISLWSSGERTSTLTTWKKYEQICSNSRLIERSMGKLDILFWNYNFQSYLTDCYLLWSSNNNAIKWFRWDPADKSTLVRVMACRRHATSHYLDQRWPIYVTKCHHWAMMSQRHYWQFAIEYVKTELKYFIE